MARIEFEFTDETLVLTEQGVERLQDILRRPVMPCLWAIKWRFKDRPNGISFHKSHDLARKFAALQLDSEPDGPARLVDVSQYIYDCVEEFEYCWTSLRCFEEAKTYEGEKWNH